MAEVLGRGAFGGALMGLANLVPGISGGTMLLAAGIYPRFIEAVASVTRLKLRVEPILLLGAVVLSAVVAIALLADPVKSLVVNQRWIMYSVFIGLTLGGVPLLLRLIGPRTKDVWIGASAGFIGMAALGLAQATGLGASGAGDANWLMYLLAGIAGASAMVLPGVSGGYLLLVLGVYVPILGAIGDATEAIKAGEWDAIVSLTLSVFVPVGIGVVVGIAGVSNLLGWLLKRYNHATLGVLLGLLLGAVVGLWPFQQAVDPAVGDVIKGVTMTEQAIAELAAEDKPTAFFAPGVVQVLASIGLIVFGFALTLMVDRIGGGGGRQSADRDAQPK